MIEVLKSLGWTTVFVIGFCTVCFILGHIPHEVLMGLLIFTVLSIVTAFVHTVRMDM